MLLDVLVDLSSEVADVRPAAPEYARGDVLLSSLSPSTAARTFIIQRLFPSLCRIIQLYVAIHTDHSKQGVANMAATSLKHQPSTMPTDPYLPPCPLRPHLQKPLYPLEPSEETAALNKHRPLLQGHTVLPRRNRPMTSQSTSTKQQLPPTTPKEATILHSSETI